MTDRIGIEPISLQGLIDLDGQDEYKSMEIHDGFWVQKYQDEVTSIAHGQFGGRLCVALWNHVDQHKLIVVHHSFDESQVYRIGDMIPGGDLLPGLALDVGFVFGTT